LNPRATALQESVGKGQKQDVGCHIVQKNCLRWYGINLRGQLMSREHALAFMGQRLSYYNQGVQTHQEILNPEGWELKRLHDFISFEIMHECIPQGMHEEINALDCQKRPAIATRGRYNVSLFVRAHVYIYAACLVLSPFGAWFRLAKNETRVPNGLNTKQAAYIYT
jgi:hypothetical protein